MASHITNTDPQSIRGQEDQPQDRGGQRRAETACASCGSGLEDHIANNPGFSLVRMLHAGSVAKGTGPRRP